MLARSGGCAFSAIYILIELVMMLGANVVSVTIGLCSTFINGDPPKWLELLVASLINNQLVSVPKSVSTAAISTYDNLPNGGQQYLVDQLALRLINQQQVTMSIVPLL